MKSLLVMMLLLAASGVAAGQTVYVGYVSDSGCAQARASAGRYSPTNPECARRCVKEGKSVVLISPEKKVVFQIDNPGLLRPQIGNKVQVYGESTGPHRLRVSRVVFLEETNPECERPPLKN